MIRLAFVDAMKTPATLAVLLLAIATGAIVVATYPTSNDAPVIADMLRSLRQDLEMEPSSEIEIIRIALMIHYNEVVVAN